jgi:hypothetical protein
VLFGRLAILSTLREIAAIPAAVDELARLHASHALPIFDQIAAPTRVWAKTESRGDTDLAAIRAARGTILASKTFVLLPTSYAMLADACIRLGERELGLDLVDDAMRLIESTSERYYEPELWRLRAALSRTRGEAIECLERGLEVAVAQHSRLFALRCATALFELAHGTEASPGARQRLREIYGEFSEGFERPDLVRARSALRAPEHAL